MDNQKRIAILGSTGSIGTQTLDVIRQHPHRFRPTLLIGGKNVDSLIKQSLEWHPEMVVIADESRYTELRDALLPLGIKTAAGSRAIADAMTADFFDTVVTATVGYSGLAPTLRAIEAGKDIALANKETLVVAGDIVTQALKKSPSRLFPVDSEHSAIQQCLVGEDKNSIRKLIITASGGPFRQFTARQIDNVKASDALKHPNWQMGAKITIDSATMINKAFEIIEARWLFDIPAHKISPIIHPQSVIHSMVEFIDGSIKAQLGLPDMRGPIRYALGENSRLTSSSDGLSFDVYSSLTFEEPDEKRFPAIRLGHYALENGGNTACIINAANEVAVAAFLADRISFPSIYELISKALSHIQYIPSPSYDDYVVTNEITRDYVSSLINAN